MDGDMVVACNFDLQWYVPHLYVKTVYDNLGKISQQNDGQPVGQPFRVHLAKLRFCQDPAAYPCQHSDSFKPVQMGLLEDGFSSGGEDDQMLRLPDYELDLDQADKIPEDHYFGMPLEARDVQEEVAKPLGSKQLQSKVNH